MVGCGTTSPHTLSDPMARLQPDAHLGYLYETAREQRVVIAPLLQLSLVRNEKVLYITGTSSPSQRRAHPQASGMEGTRYAEVRFARYAEVRFAFQRMPEGYVQTMQDNGVGRPHDLDPTTTPSVGLSLVAMLAEQLEGTLDMVREGGTTVHLTFPPAGERGSR